jgi:hypothetical protein
MSAFKFCRASIAHDKQLGRPSTTGKGARTHPLLHFVPLLHLSRALHPIFFAIPATYSSRVRRWVRSLANKRRNPTWL